MVPDPSEMRYEERRDDLTLPTSEERRIKGNTKATYKFLRGQDNVNIEQFLKGWRETIKRTQMQVKQKECTEGGHEKQFFILWTRKTR